MSCLRTVLYLIVNKPSVYFVAIPTNAAINIQNKAPGPPNPMAVATPTMLPVPIVAESDVQRAAKLDTSPFPPFSFLTIHLNASGSFLT